MRKLLIISALLMAGVSLSFAEAFAGLSFEEELNQEAMQSISGEMFTIIVPFNSTGTATVITHEKGDYCSFTVPVTTVAKANNPNNKPVNGDKEYKVVPLPSGSYTLGNTKTMSNSAYGTGIHIEASVTTPYKDNKDGSFKATDFFVHQTSNANTWGCAGISNKSGNNSEMTKVLNAYQTSTGSKTVTVSDARSSGSSSSSSSTSSSGTATYRGTSCMRPY